MPHDAVDPAPGTPGRDFLGAIGAQNNAFEQLSFEWIESYNSEGDLDILEAFGETMLALDKVVDCRWGCDEDHPEKHLVGSSVSGIRAILALTVTGYPSESGALFRPLGESANLMRLLATFPGELEAFRLGSRRQRRQKFSASRVRGRLTREGLTTPLDQRAYGSLSDFYLHPNALDHIFSHRTSHEGFVLPYFHRDMCISMFMALVSSAATALIFWACVQDDDSEVRLASALNDRIDKASRAFIVKLAQDPSVNLGLGVEGKVDWLTDKGQTG